MHALAQHVKRVAGHVTHVLVPQREIVDRERGAAGGVEAHAQQQRDGAERGHAERHGAKRVYAALHDAQRVPDVALEALEGLVGGVQLVRGRVQAAEVHREASALLGLPHARGHVVDVLDCEIDLQAMGISSAQLLTRRSRCHARSGSLCRGDVRVAAHRAQRVIHDLEGSTRN